ncbi:TadE family protein [Nocardioides sp.]|uniref:TadE/TadG family type IV pilus assembly protein n=2 Tax=unclassified Nocardioides TaxID=2615069 RepID=UPI00260B547F|nr:TadE family protein [Nocardioides sp.]
MKRRDDRGSASIEAAIAVPAFALFVGLIIFGGRTAVVRHSLESAAADAARSASILRVEADAKKAAKDAAVTNLANQGINCLRVDVAIDTQQFSHDVGTPAQVDVTVSCLLDLSDLSVPGVPGTRTISATMTSPLDTWRERSP